MINLSGEVEFEYMIRFMSAYVNNLIDKQCISLDTRVIRTAQLAAMLANYNTELQ